MKYNLNSSYSLISEIQSKYIYPAVHITCPVENVRKVSPRIDVNVWNFAATVAALEKKMLIQ